MGEGQATELQLLAQPCFGGLHQAAEHVEDGKDDQGGGNQGSDA